MAFDVQLFQRSAPRQRREIEIPLAVFTQHKPLELAKVDRIEEIGSVQLEHPDAKALQLRKPADFFFVNDLGKAIDGKVAHGGGANQTTDFYRRAMAWSFTIGWLQSEEAHAFLVPLDVVKTLPPKVQNLFGFRSFHNASKNGGTLWQANYDDIAKYLGL